MTPEDLTLVVGAITAGGGGMLTGFASWRKYRLDKRSTDDADDQRQYTNAGAGAVNLQKGQQDFMDRLQRENENWRRQVDELRALVDKLRAEIEELRHDLAVERRSRESAEARTTAEGATRRKLNKSSDADQRKITDSGDVAVQKYEDESPDLD